MLVGYAGRTTFPVSEANPKWLFGKGLKKTFLYGLEPLRPSEAGNPLQVALGAALVSVRSGLQAASLMGAEMTP